MPRRCRRGAGVLGRGCVVSDRFYVPTHGSALATFRAMRAWIEAWMKAEGKTLPVIRRAKTGQSSAPKTGHRVGGIGWKNRLVRTCLQGA